MSAKPRGWRKVGAKSWVIVLQRRGMTIASLVPRVSVNLRANERLPQPIGLQVVKEMADVSPDSGIV